MLKFKSYAYLHISLNCCDFFFHFNPCSSFLSQHGEALGCSLCTSPEVDALEKSAAMIAEQNFALRPSTLPEILEL